MQPTWKVLVSRSDSSQEMAFDKTLHQKEIPEGYLIIILVYNLHNAYYFLYLIHNFNKYKKYRYNNDI